MLTSSAREEGTFAVSSGKWYWEVKMWCYSKYTYFGIKDVSVSGHEKINDASSVYGRLCSNTGNKYILEIKVLMVLHIQLEI